MTAGSRAQWVVESNRAAASRSPSIRCSGDWTLHSIAGLEPTLSVPGQGTLVIDASGITRLDTAGAWLLHRTLRALEAEGRKVELRGLRAEHSTLLQLIATHAGELPVSQAVVRDGWLRQLGRAVWKHAQEFERMLAFVGESSMALLRALAHPQRIRWRAILHNLQAAGVAALPITGLLSFLMGVVIAYQGADQLNRFGANIFIVDLVSLSMLRELSPLLTAIIVAGRSGSAYAAQIGTMKVTEEIDALRTIGIGPQELLVLPKILALVIALPLLTVYADVTGVLGGMLMARAQLDVGFELFLDRLGDAISLSSFLTGIAKAPVFAVIIAIVGCYQGFQVSGSADSVGRQTTVSVVQSIFLVIVADALFSILFNWLKI